MDQATDGIRPARVSPMNGRVEEMGAATAPRHVGIVMDGNGRWAEARGLPRLAGHRAGAENIGPIVSECGRSGVRYVTLYAFSTENWARPREEIDGLMRLVAEFLDRDLPRLQEEGVQVRHLGRERGLPDAIRGKLRSTIELTGRNDRLTVALAFNYGGRADIVDSVRAMVARGLNAGEIEDRQIAAHLSTAGLPDPDLIIRTGGELRLSNFLIWEAAYAEYWATPVLWPDFGALHLGEAIREYGRRQRRFGAVEVRR